MSSPYLSLVRSFTAEVTLTLDGPRTAFRIAGPIRQVVDDELARLLERVSSRRATYMCLGPYLWGRDWVVHGEVREQEVGVEASRSK
jgi:hypothetical protein